MLCLLNVKQDVKPLEPDVRQKSVSIGLPSVNECLSSTLNLATSPDHGQEVYREAQ